MDDHGNTDLHLAAAMGHSRIVALCEYTADANYFGVTPLMFSIKSQDLKSFRYLVSRASAADLLARDHQGETISDYIHRYSSADAVQDYERSY
jgi:ankyrin repeat protein